MKLSKSHDIDNLRDYIPQQSHFRYIYILFGVTAPYLTSIWSIVGVTRIT